MKNIRVAAVISCSPVGKVSNNLDNMAGWLETAKKKDASIICFPEMNITGYNSGEHMINSAETIPGPIIEEVCQMANHMDIVILAGMAEKDIKGNIFASHVVVKPGNNVGVYRKVHISPAELDIFSPGNTVPLFDFQSLTFGIQLCYDAHFPELTTRMAIDGADIIFMPHASPRKSPKEKLQSWLRHLTARAYDNSVFIIACNQTDKNGMGLHFPGVAVAIDPAGEILDTYVSNDEGLLMIDLKADILRSVRKHRMKYFLPNRRPEIYNLK
jgi:N-carbamoylputrescine amidase